MHERAPRYLQNVDDVDDTPSGDDDFNVDADFDDEDLDEVDDEDEDLLED
jgi:hypothetical protein